MITEANHRDVTAIRGTKADNRMTQNNCPETSSLFYFEAWRPCLNEFQGSEVSHNRVLYVRSYFLHLSIISGETATRMWYHVYVGHFFVSVTNVYHDWFGHSHVHASSEPTFQPISAPQWTWRLPRGRWFANQTKSGFIRNWFTTQRTTMVGFFTAHFAYSKCGLGGHAHSITAFKPQITGFTWKIHLYGHSNAFDIWFESFYFDALLASFTFCISNHWPHFKVRTLGWILIKENSGK